LMTFGLGISLVVAPLTSTLMSSIPTRNAGLGSAINNAVSRVGTPLLGAVLFIIVSATFYTSLGSQVSGLNTDDAAVRTTFPPLNQPTEQVSPEQVPKRGRSRERPPTRPRNPPLAPAERPLQAPSGAENPGSRPSIRRVCS